MEYIDLKDITPENVIGFAKDGIKEFEILKENKDVDYCMIANWRVKYGDVCSYIYTIKKQSAKRIKKLHLKSTKTDVIAQYQDNKDLFEELIKTAIFAGKFLYQLMGMNIEEDGLVPVIYRVCKYLPFTYDVHQVLINKGLTEISCPYEIKQKKDNRLNVRSKRKRNYALMATNYISWDEKGNEVPNNAEDNGLDIEPTEFINAANNGHSYPIKSKWLKKLYQPKGSLKFYLFMPMESEYFQKLYGRIKCAKSISRMLKIDKFYGYNFRVN